MSLKDIEQQEQQQEGVGENGGERIHSVAEDALLVWRALNDQQQLNHLTLEMQSDLEKSYLRTLVERSMSSYSICVLVGCHVVLPILWFPRRIEFHTNHLSDSFAALALIATLDSLVVITIFFAAILLLNRISSQLRAYGYTKSLLMGLLAANDIISLLHGLSVSLFLALQSTALASLPACSIEDLDAKVACNPCGDCAGLPIESLVFSLMSPFLLRFAVGYATRELLLLSWIVPFLITTITIASFNLNALGLIPLLYFGTLLVLYWLERRSREWFLVRVVGRVVLRDMMEYEHAQVLSNQLSKDLRDIISYTAHDMKSPCTAMQLGLNSMKQLMTADDPPTTEEEFELFTQECYQLIHNLNSTLAFMVMTNNRSMDFAKIHRGLKLVPVHDTVNINTAIKWAISCVNWQNEDTVKIDPQSTGLELTGLTEKSWLKDNLLCTIANACKFTEEGTDVIVKVTKLGVGGREWIEVRVSDDGPNLGKADLQSFFEAPTQKKRYEVGGRGLGLFCLAQRVAFLQGAFGAEPRKGYDSGCTIWFRIPFHDNSRQVSRPVAVAAPPKNSRNSRRDKAQQQRGKDGFGKEQRKVAQFILEVPEEKTLKQLETVLVVDDSIPILKMTSLVLERANCQVDKAKNGLVALEKMKERIYDLVIMDVEMPVMAGSEATQKIRQFEHQQRRTRQLIVGVSANSEGIMKSLCLDAGMDCFSIKPFTLEDMLAIYRKHQIPHD